MLRAVILVIATLLLAYAAWLGASSLYKISRSPDSVVEKEASVAADELTDAEMAALASPSALSGGKSAQNTAHRAYYRGFSDRYYALYRKQFEPYRQQQDKRLTRAEFEGAFINSAQRLEAISSGELSFESDRGDLETLFKVMSEAATRADSVQSGS